MGRKKNKAQASVQDEPTTTTGTVSDVVEAPRELRAQDDGFVFPLGENAETTAAIYYCRSPICPGYSTQASDTPHPATTCGNILNSDDGRVEAVKIHEQTAVIERPSPTEPFNVPPDPPAVVNESNVQIEDMPQLEPDDVVHAEDSPAAAGESLPDSVELPSPVADMFDVIGDPVPARLVVEPEGLDRYLFTPTFAPGFRFPICGTYWREPGMSDGHCYAVTGLNPGEGFVLCLFYLAPTVRECLCRIEHFLNGDLCPLTKRPAAADGCEFSTERISCVPLLENAHNRGLRASQALSMWVPIVGTYWSTSETVFQVLSVNEVISVPFDPNRIRVRVFWPNGAGPDEMDEAVGVFLSNQLEYFPDPTLLPEWVTTAPKPIAEPEIQGPTVEQIGLGGRCVEIASELDVDVVHVERLIDGALVAISSVLSFKGMADGNPAADAVISRVSSEKFISYFRGIMQGFNNGVALDVNKVVEYINTKLEPRVDALEERSGTEDDPGIPAQIAQMRKSFGDIAEGLDQDIKQIRERIDELESPDLELRRAQEEFDDDVVSKPKATKKAKKPKIMPENAKVKRRKRDQARRARLAQQDEQLRMRQLRVPGTGPETLDDEPPKNGPKGGRQKGHTVAAGAAPWGSKTRKKKGKPGRPKGAKNKPKLPVSDMAARAKVSTKPASKPPKNAAKPLVKGVIASNSHQWNQFISTPAILKLLVRIPPSQVAKFIEQARKRLPDMRLTPWDANEQGRFAQWYFSNPGTFA
jgi:hypothetical protein